MSHCSYNIISINEHYTYSAPIRGLISAPPIPVGLRGVQRNPVESGGVKFGREAC
ncbi:hypothetical protein K443DRAFT_111313 [Laccaria amethystina LaAM-08-1]|uniref:Uncharacterized protein n=1 Tax=Laccaria amethystina LaAM-08-1 TaxID=1095629 RepID=A0A0C9X8I0_9AGAR|nr:hypothetical protein K443DRAFT_111313 [Laccaria amethystina LaAM-08-1]